MLGFSALSETAFATLSGDAIRLESSANLDSNFILIPQLNIKYLPQVDLTIDSQFLSDAINRSSISSDLLNKFELAIDSLIQIPVSADIVNGSSLSSDYAMNVIAETLLQVNSNLESSSLLKILASSDINISSILDATITTLSFNGADLQIIAVIDASFSQVNQDIVYYVVYTNKIKPFNMTIARVKN